MDINQIIRNTAKQIPGGRLSENFIKKIAYAFHYKKLLKSNSISEHNLLIIGTIARSGTHYVMLLLANYISLISRLTSSVGPSEMNEMFPNNWHLNYMSYHKLPFGPMIVNNPNNPNKDIKNIGLDEITRSHSLFQDIFWGNSNILHLYRNPLDYSVSLFNYKHKKREGISNKCENPNEVLELKFNNYCDMYNSYKNASKSGKYRILRISYENLILNPEFYLESILTWLGNEPIEDFIKKAVEHSSIKKVKNAEKQGSAVNPDATNLTGSFISSGQIGQWKNFYNSDDFKYWEKRFKEKNIELQDFILD